MTPPEADQPSTSGINPASSWSPSTPPARDWQSHWEDVLPELEELARRRKRPPDAAIMRASQLDAARLDTELAAMLREQFMKIFSFFQPRLISAFQPELTLILELLIFRFSVWAGKPTPGSALMNLRYRDERHGRALPKQRSSSEPHQLTADLAGANAQVLTGRRLCVFMCGLLELLRCLLASH
ncbi:hypothetical protein ABBQ38_005331 [Trebouxia sp. C0009 RCD-2024]